MFQNGYTYHTALDNLTDYLNGTFQASGDNMLAFLTEIMNSPEELSHSLEDAAEGEPTKTTFFDILGLAFFTYDRSVAKILAIVETVVFIVVACVALPFLVKKCVTFAHFPSKCSPHSLFSSSCSGPMGSITKFSTSCSSKLWLSSSSSSPSSCPSW